MQQIYPILVPSKDRATTSTLLPILQESGLKFWFVVEPQDKSGYADQLGDSKLLVMPENNQGLAYSRNYILDFARDKGFNWFWMLDDDITKFCISQNKRNLQVDIKTALCKAQNLLRINKSLGQAALEYQQYSWSAVKPYAFNSYCDVCVCINTLLPKHLRFRDYVNLKLDRDFTLQVLAAGFKTLRTSKISFAAPKNGSNRGGLFDAYASGIEFECSKRMVELWGDNICQLVTKSDQRKDVKINWGFFKEV